jgi:hypothetical protein
MCVCVCVGVWVCVWVCLSWRIPRSAAPFDRHDWVVDRCGMEVRYIIDFYNATPAPGDPRPIAMHLDVRPALDSWQAAWDRTRRFWGFFSQ